MLIKPKVRQDLMGSGEYGAPRGSRTHKGIDFVVAKENEVITHVTGVVTKIGYPYAQKFDTKKNKLKSALRYVEITKEQRVDDKLCQVKHRFFYLNPSVRLGDAVEAGTCIGTAQDLKAIYGLTMKNHCHYEVMIGKEYYDPARFL